MTNDMSLENRTIVVTGGAQGIGQAVARKALSLGANVAVIDMRREPIDELAQQHPDRLLVQTGSVSDEAFVQQAMQATVDRFGAIDGLVNNAGITRPAMLMKMDRQQWDDVIDVNLTGCFVCLQAAATHMVQRFKENGIGGAIVNISSDAGRKGTLGQVNYGAAKSGVLGLTMSAARELARYQVRVNSILFGVVATEMTTTLRTEERFRERYLEEIPLGHFLEPDVAARSIAFLLSDASAYITGQHLSVNGGWVIGV
ncbi:MULTISPECIES: SDR family NAD(P)-dependent oxidoreductase [Sphingobium]|uniref:SDR family NAD(P)-dependent oxidoreductase n=1 Tax=Sphingobium TaxID=165695 RepID=UPI00159C0D3D|nr:MULTISPECIES: 3-oxoacyl-ACP reductase family protein [unclassified Sphingobium]